MAPGIGFPDLIVFICMISSGINNALIPTLTYYSIALDEYSTDNFTLIEQCYAMKDVTQNSTCKEMGSTVESALTSLTVKINIVKAILSPLSMFLLGGLSDAVGKRFPVYVTLAINLCWSLITMANTYFLTSFRPNYYIFDNGFILGLSGGSFFTISTYLVGYLAITTPPQQQTQRFSTLMSVGLLGTTLGHLFAGLYLQFSNLKYAFFTLGSFSTGLVVIGLLLSIFCLRRVDPVTDLESSISQTRSLRGKAFIAFKHQYYNTIDMFRHQAYLGKFVMANFMYMLTIMGCVSPLIVITNVYLLAAPFKWSATSRSYLVAGLLTVTCTIEYRFTGA